MKKGMNRKSQSGIITTVLLIVIVIVSIIIIWNVVYMIMKNSNVSSGISGLTTQLEIKQTKLYVTGGAEIQVHRNSGKGDISGLKFIFENKNGERKIVTRLENISELETRSFNFTLNETGYSNIEIKSIYVVPMFGDSNGIEVGENSDAFRKDSGGNRVMEPNTTSGLISWWKFDGNMIDSISLNDGSCSSSSCPILTQNNRGDINSAYSFDGKNYISTTKDMSLYTNSMSVAAWVKSNSSGFVIQNYHVSLGPFEGFGLYYATNQVKFWASDPSSPAWIYCYSNLADNNWHFVAATLNGIGSKTKKIYLDGQLCNSSDVASIRINSTIPITIGSEYIHTTNLTGSLDNVMLFNRSLSSEEILALYNNQR